MLIGASFLALAAGVPASATALESATPLDLAAGVDGDGAGPLAIAAAVARQPTAYGARDSGPSPHKNADLGALTLKQRQAATVCPDSCPPGFFGFCRGDPIGTETCGEHCCVGEDACEHFSGCVKGDGSCFGEAACLYANVPTIENSCKGTEACKDVGKYAAVLIGAIKDSCNGEQACDSLSYEGVVGTVTQSCNGIEACNEAGNVGTIGSITQSCNGLEACEFVAASWGSKVGPMTKSCNRDKACKDLANEGEIASITKTCNNDKHKPCVLVDLSHGTFGHMVNFVHDESIERHTRDSIESILDCMVACQNNEECNGIKWKEHTGRPCWLFGGGISDYPCNGRNVCITL